MIKTFEQYSDDKKYFIGTKHKNKLLALNSITTDNYNNIFNFEFMHVEDMNMSDLMTFTLDDAKMMLKKFKKYHKKYGNDYNWNIEIMPIEDFNLIMTAKKYNL